MLAFSISLFFSGVILIYRIYVEVKQHTCIEWAGVNNELKSLVEVFCLCQYVASPTRNATALDLSFCNSPEIAEGVDVIRGISDHSVVVAVHRNALTDTRKVFLSEKGSYDDVARELRDQFPSFECLAETADIRGMWSFVNDENVSAE